MSDFRTNRYSVPPRWLYCPRKAVKLIENKFLAFKTPLSAEFDDQVPAECRFSIDMLFSSIKSQRLKLGLWIDLTNTNRFYDKKAVEAQGCKYLKLQCRGHGETPSLDQTKTFVQLCKNFIAQNPLEIVGVHCTHGFNRTGFLIISYLVETEVTSVDAGLAEFASARPPGIYKGDYIQELFKRYDDEEDAPAPPERPPWCLEYDDSNGNDDTDEATTSDTPTVSEPAAKRRKREHQNNDASFMEGVPGVTPLMDNSRLKAIQKRVKDMCGWKSNGFPGSQPVSMEKQNIQLLHLKPYRVSWKADGTRYMLFIQGEGELYFIDRNNSVFKIEGLTFPHPKEHDKHLKDTLLDGEMVIDRVEGKEIPRYLAYDILMYNSRDVKNQPFYPNRYCIIEQNVMAGRYIALTEGRLRRDHEPFSIRRKEFWDVTQAGSLLGEKFAKQLSHEPDGLIFQPANAPYFPGAFSELLKWKPMSLNSVDFKLKITTESGPGLVTRKIGHLFVGGLEIAFASIKITKALKGMNNKIIECKFENDQWVFMRERTDKAYPNSYRTAQSVCQSIRDPVTTEILLDYIDQHRFVQDDAELMPPPNRRRSVQIWCTKDLACKDRKSVRINLGYDHATHVRWSPDGKAFIVHNFTANSMDVWRLTKSTKKGDFTFKSATKVLEFPKKHEDDIVGMDIACNGRYIITCSKMNDLIVWDLKGEQLATIDTYLGPTHKARISPCGRFVAASGFTPDVKMWEIVFTKTGEFKQVSKAFDLTGHSSGIYDFNFCADTSNMASVSKDGTYRFYDTKIEFEKGEDPRLLVRGTWDVASTASIAVSPNGEVVVVAHGSSLTFYSTVNGAMDTTIEDIFNGPITCLTFDAAGVYVLVAGDKQIKIFHNVAGYRAAIESAKRKLEQRQTSATKERLEETIAKSKTFLAEMGEPLVQ